MTYREIRDHKFKILFMYYFLNTSIDDVLLNYFENCPYEEDDDINDYTRDSNKAHVNINVNGPKEDKETVSNVSDKAITITITDEDSMRDIKHKVNEIIAKTDEIDKLIKEHLKDWDLNRVGKAELTIIRLAIYEMYFDSAIDLPVAINEAVELAKVYGDDKADKFVNGVLATIYKNKK